MKLLALCFFLACASAQYWPGYTQPGYSGWYNPYLYPAVAPAPFYGKTTLNTVVAETNPSAPTPADTTKFDYKQKSFEVVSPYVYPTPSVYPVPSVYPTPYVYPTSYNPYTYPIYQNTAANPAAPSPATAGAPLKVESSRKKRQVVAVLPNKQFVDDLKYKSVDLNQDGQPDVPVYPALPTIKYVQPTLYPTWPSWSTLSTPYTYGYLG